MGDSGTPSSAGEDGRPEAFHPVQRLEAQVAWYGSRAASSKRWYQRVKVLQIVMAAAVPVAAAAAAHPIVIGSLGGVIVVLEGIQQVFQLQPNWTSYRATAEALKHEKYLHLAQAGPYADAARPDRLLAERVEGLVSQEHATWVGEQRELMKAGRAE
jgi:hypothetical protein